jgi:exodeoxyribonuclease VII small subunit
METTNLKYEEAVAELQQIMQELQQEQVSIDDLTAKSARAQELITFCQNKLSDLNTTLGKAAHTLDQ